MKKSNNRIREIRQSRGLKQRELAEASHICQTTVSELERGVRKPWLSALEKIASALKVHVSDLVTEKRSKDRRVKQSEW